MAGRQGRQLEELAPEELAIGTGHFGCGASEEGPVQMEVAPETAAGWEVSCFIDP